jgi:hypothetical protein
VTIATAAIAPGSNVHAALGDAAISGATMPAILA